MAGKGIPLSRHHTLKICRSEEENSLQEIQAPATFEASYLVLRKESLDCPDSQIQVANTRTMYNKLQQSLVSGMLATMAMTAFTVIGGAMGMPKISPPDRLAVTMKIPVAAGWVMHFMIGIIFATAYVLFFNDWLRRITSKLLRGVLYGIIAYIVGHFSVAILGAVFGNAGTPQPHGSPVLRMIGLVVAHIVFGITIALMVKPVTPVTK